MDWAPYDMATLHAILTPTAVTIRDAWMTTPEAALPPGVSPRAIDVEFHAGALLYETLRSPAGRLRTLRMSSRTGETRFLFEGTQATAELD